MNLGINFYESANDACKNLDAELVEFNNDNEVKSFINLLKGGNEFILSLMTPVIFWLPFLF
jgi:hypothetical protein